MSYSLCAKCMFGAFTLKIWIGIAKEHQSILLEMSYTKWNQLEWIRHPTKLEETKDTFFYYFFFFWTQEHCNLSSLCLYSYLVKLHSFKKWYQVRTFVTHDDCMNIRWHKPEICSNVGGNNCLKKKLNELLAVEICAHSIVWNKL